MNINREDYACKCGCGQDTVDYELVAVIEDVERHFGAEVEVTSGNRCVAHNKAEGGSSRSQHLLGKAADIYIPNVTPIMVHAYLKRKYSDKYGIGKYRTFTHIDVRTKKARW